MPTLYPRFCENVNLTRKFVLSIELKILLPELVILVSLKLSYLLNTGCIVIGNLFKKKTFPPSWFIKFIFVGDPNKRKPKCLKRINIKLKIPPVYVLIPPICISLPHCMPFLSVYFHLPNVFSFPTPVCESLTLVCKSLAQFACNERNFLQTFTKQWDMSQLEIGWD